MLKYEDIIRIANTLAEKDVCFNKKLNINMSTKEEALLYTSRFNYYNKILSDDTLIDESNDDRTLIED